MAAHQGHRRVDVFVQRARLQAEIVIATAGSRDGADGQIRRAGQRWRDLQAQTCVAQAVAAGVGDFHGNREIRRKQHIVFLGEKGRDGGAHEHFGKLRLQQAHLQGELAASPGRDGNRLPGHLQGQVVQVGPGVHLLQRRGIGIHRVPVGRSKAIRYLAAEIQHNAQAAGVAGAFPKFNLRRNVAALQELLGAKRAVAQEQGAVTPFAQGRVENQAHAEVVRHSIKILQAKDHASGTAARADGNAEMQRQAARLHQVQPERVRCHPGSSALRLREIGIRLVPGAVDGKNRVGGEGVGMAEGDLAAVVQAAGRGAFAGAQSVIATRVQRGFDALVVDDRAAGSGSDLGAGFFDPREIQIEGGFVLRLQRHSEQQSREGETCRFHDASVFVVLLTT